MNNKIVFKEPFESKLNELRVKRAFVRNIRKSCKNHGTNFDMRLQAVNAPKDWKEFIQSAFIWNKTPEGIDFWQHISET